MLRLLSRILKIDHFWKKNYGDDEREEEEDVVSSVPEESIEVKALDSTWFRRNKSSEKKAKEASGI